MSDPTISLYRGQSRGHRYGFRVTVPGQEVHDSGLIYNDDIHANVGVAKFMGFKDKDGFPIRGSNISLNKRCELGRKALHRLRDGGVKTEFYQAGART